MESDMSEGTQGVEKTFPERFVIRAPTSLVDQRYIVESVDGEALYAFCGSGAVTGMVIADARDAAAVRLDLDRNKLKGFFIRTPPVEFALRDMVRESEIGRIRVWGRILRRPWWPSFTLRLGEKALTLTQAKVTVRVTKWALEEGGAEVGSVDERRFSCRSSLHLESSSLLFSAVVLWAGRVLWERVEPNGVAV